MNLEDEDVRFRLYLEAKGYDTKEMGLKGNGSEDVKK